MQDADLTPYYRLDPDTILQAVESLGLECDGCLLALNSYENRVYQVGLEGQPPVIVKFYRPGRWTDKQILEEHEFAWQLAAADIPLIPPLRFSQQTLHFYAGFRFALFRRRGGHAPELDNKDTLEWLGRVLGRLHAVGASRDFRLRPALDIDSFACQPVAFLTAGGWLPPHLRTAFETLSADLLDSIGSCYARAGGTRVIRLHGDCHPGNILWRDGPLFVDLDDARSGPAIQDLWMLLSGSGDEMAAQMQTVLDGYCQFFHFNPAELQLIEALRTMRMLHHAAWLAKRWQDPAFPVAFPWFGESRYWEDLIQNLREQLGLMQEPAIQLADAGLG